MMKRKYGAPVLFDLDDGGNGTVIGQGTGQGSLGPYGMTYEEWFEDLCWGIFGSVDEDGANPDCDYNGDGYVNEDDWDYWFDNQMWNG